MTWPKFLRRRRQRDLRAALGWYTLREARTRLVKTSYYDMLEIEYHHDSANAWIADLRSAA